MPFVAAIQATGPATEACWAFAFVGNQLLVPQLPTPPAGADAAAATPAPAPAPALQALARDLAWAELAQAAHSRHYLGTLAGQDCWALALDEAPAGWQPIALRAALAQLPDRLGALAGRAAQVLEWDRTHRHCGVCGTPTERKADERARVCPACGHSAWPRLSPAMMALVWRPGALLLARSPHFPPGMYSALAGFVEAGESLEDCLHREVAEEVGVQVQAPHYFGSQSWPFPHSLMVAYTARYARGEVRPQPGEIEDAAWFALDALPAIPPPLSIAGRLIRDAVARLQQGLPLDGAPC